jgi:hypothetical protein
MTREDAGFDLFALLGVDLLIAWLKGVKLAARKPSVFFALGALLYSVLVLVLQHMLWPGDHALSRVYLGSPPFQGISGQVLMDRLAFYMKYRLYIFLPLYFAAAWALRLKRPEFFAGFIAVGPWAGLSFLAVSSYAATLCNYYAFPFIFALFWPLAGGRLEGAGRSLGCAVDGRVLAGFGLMLACSFVEVSFQQNPARIDFPRSFYCLPSLQMQRETDQALRGFVEAGPLLGRVAVDGSVAALVPDGYEGDQIVWYAQQDTPDTVIFFQQGQGAPFAMQLARQAGLHEFYLVKGTAIRVASRKNLDIKALGLTVWPQG